MTAAPDLRPADLATGFTHLGHSDQGGRPDAMQVQYWDDHVYVGHLFSGGFSVIDVTEPRRPGTVSFVPAPDRTWNIHLQAADDLLLVIHARDLWKTLDVEQDYYRGSVGARLGGAPKDWSAGVAIYDISIPGAPRPISFLPVDGIGVHRLWFTGGRYAYASVLPDGFSDYVLRVIDLADPAHPRWAGEYWLPGMNTAAGEQPTWDASRWRYALHHAIVAGDTAYASWRDGGLTLLDVSDRAAPTLVSHRNWSPPYGGGTHTALPLPGRDLLVVADEATADDVADGLKHVWVFDIREPENPVSIATFPTPAEDDYATKGRHFGPHNLHENRPGSFVSEELVFATFQNAGVRAFDLTDPYAPRQVAAFVPGAPETVIDPRPGGRAVVQTADVYVRDDGITFITDYNGGLDVLEFTGKE
ncbi:LVIVD repeat-containing protein [Cellulosimicrobium cellulans]|uniref:LVIVD repeat-containing protein n=1 Tax=Cellulosimicrobium cellulans TaxID=1710 RepID=UPI0037F2F192